MADPYTYAYHTPTNLSFSSTLLDEICRSIDTPAGGDDAVSMRKKQLRDDDVAPARFLFKTDEDMANYQRACMIDKWMDKKKTKKKNSPQEKMPVGKEYRQYSSSSSSDSSCGGGGFFSSSEAESFPFRHPKPVRTGKIIGFEKGKICVDDSAAINRRGLIPDDVLEQKPKINESRFVKTKSKALKLYGDLKKVKQPISPGGKVTAFLNSLFAAGNLKKTKITADDSPSLKSTATTCSSASSFSRSCLSKTTTSEKYAKRSVRFLPVSVIVDEDFQPCGQNNDDVDLIGAAIDEELTMHVRRKGEPGSELEHCFDIFSRNRDRNRSFDGEFDDEFDGASCASSDLFELENLSAIGMEELPVYETTQLEIIQTVANGLIL